MNLFAVVFLDELQDGGRAKVRFNVKTPNPHFAHVAVLQNQRRGQPATLDSLLLAVQRQYPTARHESQQGQEWITTEALR